MNNEKQKEKIKNSKGKEKEEADKTTPKKFCALINTLLTNLLFNILALPGLPSWKIVKPQYFKRSLIKGPAISGSSQFSKWPIESKRKR